jgi:myosin heavy subunit
LFVQNLGLLNLIDEESRFPRATDKSLIEKLHSHFKSSSRYVKPRLYNDISFGINHYAGKVIYNARGFLEKNRDNLGANLVDCLKNSHIKLVVELFAAERSATGSISRLNSNIGARPFVPARPRFNEIKRSRESLTQKKAKSLKQKM